MQIQHEDGTVSLRPSERSLNYTGTDNSELVVYAVHCEIFYRSHERGESTYSERYSGKMGCVRGEKSVGRHHIRRNVARHSDIHSQHGNDIKLRGLGSYFLHSWNVTVDLVHSLLHIFRRLSGGAKVHNGAGENAHCDLVRSSTARLLENESTVEKYIHIGTVSGSDRHQYSGQLLLVLFAHAAAALHEQDIAIRHQNGEFVMIICGIYSIRIADIYAF